MADIRLKFFNKEGNPLNFDYIGPTGDNPLDSKFTYRTSISGAGNPGDLDITEFPTYYNFLFNVDDLNAFDMTSWYSEAVYCLDRGTEIYLEGSVAGQNDFRGKISAVNLLGNQLTITIPSDYYSGQSIISPDNQIYFTTPYKNRPGGYFKGNIYFDPVSANLYENEQIFVVQEFYNVTTSQITYGLPHTGATGATASPQWRSRWYNDNYGETDVSEIIFTYSISDQLDGGDGEPLIVSYPNMIFDVDVNPNDFYSNGYVNTTTSFIDSSALPINVALNGPEGAENIYERKLIIDDISTGTPEKILEVDYYGQIIGEDERFKVLLANLGRSFYSSDSVILRDHDPAEPLPNYLEINEKRKELMVAGEEIFPYIGSYKGLINALKFFGYQDLRIKEYWLNLKYNGLRVESPIQQNKNFLNAINKQQSQGYNMSYQIGDILDNPNSGKYKLTQTYGPNKNGEYVLDVTSEDTLVPSRTYKKTSLFGLYYDLNKVTGEDDEFNLPIVEDAFKFTQEEVLIKIFALKERLKRDYLPLNARIIDITGEGIYFGVYNTKSWTDIMGRSDFDSGFEFDFYPNPDFGFLEDLRNFSTRPLIGSIQSPSSYNNSYTTDVQFLGGTGSAIYFSGNLPNGSTGPNPVLNLYIGQTYDFNIVDPNNYGYNLIITTDPNLSQIDPLGIVDNGATGGNSITWYIEPGQTSPVYYYSSANPILMLGTINILPPILSDLGNIINPLDSQQIYNSQQNQSMLGAIDNFYKLKQEGKIIELGDDKYDPVAYIDPNTGQQYDVPIGMPVILELFPDIWTWNELNTSWDSIMIPAYRVGDRVEVPSVPSFGTVVGVSYSTGQYNVLLDPPYNTTTQFGEMELFATTQVFLLLTWGNIDFSNAMEIEWIVDKTTTQSGSPYNFNFRGPIADFYKMAHFLPYSGDYKITCNVYDAFNAKSTVIKNSIIKVQPKTIDIDSWTRYREVENYIWDNVDRGWDSYKSIWEYPAEGDSIEVLEKTIPSEILKFATYGNKAEEGQSLYVKTNLDPVGATGEILLSQNIIQIDEIYALQIFIGQYGSATISTITPHGLNDGDELTIIGSIPEINGRWTANIVSSTVFTIPSIISNSWNGVVLETSPINRYIIDPTIYTAQKITGAGLIKVYVNNREIGSADAGDTLYHTANAITSSINSLRTYPDYFASCLNPSTDPVSIIIYAPDELGSDQNGVSLSADISGTLSINFISSTLENGVSPSETYVYWSENSEIYPNDNLRFWGTKNLDWQIFNEASWNDGYAHSWYDFEFNNDWLGGYELHTILPGDHVKVSTGNSTYPFPVGVTLTGSGSSITIQDVADQLNNSDETHITNFYYRPIPSDTGSLSTITGPINLDLTNASVPVSTYPAPPSLIGGSNVLIPNFGYTGGTPITTTSTTTTTTIAPPTTTTTTSTTTTSTTTTTTAAPTTTTTTTIDPCLLAGNAVMIYPTTTTTTTTLAPTTTTTTTIPPGGQVTMINLDNTGDIDDVQVDFNPILVSPGTFPVLPNTTGVGNYGVGIPAFSQVQVNVSSVFMYTAINLSLSTGYTACFAVDPMAGFVIFSGVDLSTNPDITITLELQGTACV
jgi:hypothetical protein